MTRLTEFLGGRGAAEMYETYWVPRTLWRFAVFLAELGTKGRARGCAPAQAML